MPSRPPERPRESTSNRRNHYRTLHVQPDAPFEVIKANYRTLMQKLKLHPDLGGDHWAAVHVNAAYAILSNPARRAAYDRKLLASYDIATLSRGPLPAGRAPRARSHRDDQRNYYRVLGVQPDAPDEVIEASHHALVSRDTRQGPPLTEALATLRDPARRLAYDRSLGLRGRTGVPQTAEADSTLAAPVAARRRAGAYEPLVTRYCLFCKTPHHDVPSALEHGCVECGSPLFPPPADFLDHVRRSLGRSPKDEAIGFYTFWPGERYTGRLIDLSPTGLRFLTAHRCETGTILKIEAQGLQAVGAVAHWHDDPQGITAGVRFHTVGFQAQRGSFISTSA